MKFNGKESLVDFFKIEVLQIDRWKCGPAYTREQDKMTFLRELLKSSQHLGHKGPHQTQKEEKEGGGKKEKEKMAKSSPSNKQILSKRAQKGRESFISIHCPAGGVLNQ